MAAGERGAACFQPRDRNPGSTAIPATTRSRPPPSSSPISAPSLSPSAPTQVAEIAYHEKDWPTDRKCTSKKHPDKAPYKGPNDLESVAGIPGKPHLVLLCESTNSRNDKCNSTNSLDKDFPADRIYLAEVILGEDINDDGAPDGVTAVSISDHTSFSSFTYSHNVEGTAVARYGSSEDKYLFLWAERNETTIRWADLELEPNLVIHKEKGSKSFELSTFASWSNRPVVGLDVDSETGDIYLVTSYDAGSEASSATVNADNGPYRSATSIIGNVNTTDGNVVIYNEPHAGKVSHHEGFKVETVARAQNISTKPFMTKCVPSLYFACPLSPIAHYTHTSAPQVPGDLHRHGRRELRRHHPQDSVWPGGEPVSFLGMRPLSSRATSPQPAGSQGGWSHCMTRTRSRRLLSLAASR